jgi:hypothetical protein
MYFFYFADKERDLLETLPALWVLFPSNFHLTPWLNQHPRWYHGKNLKPPKSNLIISKYYSYPWSHPLFHPLSSLLSPPIPSLSGIRKVKKFYLNLSMKCWHSAFNAQGSRLIIVVVQVGAVKIHVAAVTALTKTERGDETQFTSKIGEKTSLGPSYFVL